MGEFRVFEVTGVEEEQEKEAEMFESVPHQQIILGSSKHYLTIQIYNICSDFSSSCYTERNYQQECKDDDFKGD